jgi:hypothetical protein
MIAIMIARSERLDIVVAAASRYSSIGGMLAGEFWGGSGEEEIIIPPHTCLCIWQNGNTTFNEQVPSSRGRALLTTIAGIEEDGSSLGGHKYLGMQIEEMFGHPLCLHGMQDPSHYYFAADSTGAHLNVALLRPLYEQALRAVYDILVDEHRDQAA